MPGNRYPIIARESWPILALIIALLIFAKLQFGMLGFSVMLCIAFFFLFLFRDPYRSIPSDPLAIVSPVYGVVTRIEETKNTHLKCISKRVQVKMRVYDIYSMRSPIEGKIYGQQCFVSEGKRARRHINFWIKTDEDDNIITAVSLRRFVRWCHVYLHSGERVGHGQRCGYFYFGGVVDVLIPIDSRIEVKVGDTVLSGSTIIAHLIHPRTATMVRGAGKA